MACGYLSVPDHNAPDALGVGPFPVNALGGIRQSTALTYLQPARQRSNLEVRGRLDQWLAGRWAGGIVAD